MRNDQRDISAAAFATAVAALVGGLFWMTNDRRDAELAWACGIAAAAYAIWKLRQRRTGSRD
jgi:hypothetical protein